MIRNIIARRTEVYDATSPDYVPDSRLAPSPNGTILILGAARSGTTWLATIFDSHEDVLYRHEPDIRLRQTSIPQVCGRAAIGRYREEARAYLLQLAVLAVRNTAGRPLLFRKSYRSAVACAMRISQIYLYRVLANIWPAADALTVADRMRRGTNSRVLIKSVSACGRAGLYAEALPEACIIFVVRSPFGQVASMLRGTTTGRLDGYRATNRLADWHEASDYGLTAGDFEAMSLVERLAWHWVLSFAKVLDDLEGRPNIKMVAYERLCETPLATAEQLFEFVGLTMSGQTRRFITRSTRSRISDSYYSVFKNPAVVANRWKESLTSADQAIIQSIVERTRAYDEYRRILSA